MVQSKAILASGIDGVTAFADRVYVQNISESSGALEATYTNSLSGIVAAAVQEALQTEFIRGAFGDLIVAQPTMQVYAVFPYAIESGICAVSGIGAFTTTTESGMAKLTTPATTSGKVVLNTRKHLLYVPSQGGDVKVTPVFQSGVGSQKQLVGMGNDANGLFFGMSGAVGGIWYRHFGQEDFIPQTTWNIDPFPNLDWSKGNVFQIQFQWLGFGKLCFNMEDPDTGTFKTLHRIDYTNRHQTPSFLNPSFPLRIEVDNNGSGVALTTKVSCLAGRTEGAKGLKQSFAVSGAASTSGAAVHFMTIRNKANFHGQSNHRLVDLHHLYMAIDGNNNMFVELYKNIAVSGLAYTDISTHESVVEKSLDGQLPPSLSGMLDGMFIFKNTANNITEDENDWSLGPNETVTIVIRRTAGVNVDVYGLAHIEEHY